MMDKEEASHCREWEELAPEENASPASSTDGGYSIRSLHIELLQMILLWGHEGADKAPDEGTWGIPKNKRKAALAAHLIICRLVCKQWRDCLPLPPQGFLFSFGSTVAAQGSISLLQWAKEEMIPSFAWDGRSVVRLQLKKVILNY